MIRAAPAVLVSALVALSIAPFPEQQASASCVGRQVGDRQTVLTHRGTQTVTGRYFHEGCADTQSCSVGCHGGCQDDDPETPSEDVELRITQFGRSWPLATADADEKDRVTWTFRLPAGVEPGQARLLAEGAAPVVVTVR